MAQKDFGPTSDLGPTGRSIHTKFYTPVANKNDCDMGIVHDYRYVNTLYMYRVNTTYQTTLIKTYDVCNNISASDPLLYFEVFNQGIEGKHLEDLNGEIPYSLEIEFTNLPTYKIGYSSDVTLSSGSKFQINAKDYFPSTFNIVATAAAHTLEYPAYQYPNQVIDLTAQHSYRNINTRNLYRNNLGKLDVSYDVGARSASGYSYGYSNSLTISGGSFYNSVNVYTYNIPSGSASHTATKDLDSYIYGNNPSIDMAASHSYRYINTSGKLYYMYSGSRYQPTIDVGRLASGGSTAYTGTYDTRQSGNNFYKEVNMFLSNIPTSSGGVSINSKIPLLSTEARIGTASSWNALLPYNGNIYNPRLANGYIAKSGLGLHCNFGGEGPYKSEALSYFINTSYSTPLTGTRLYFMNSSYLRFSKHPYGLIANSTGNRFGLYINHTGWYEIEFGSWMPSYDEYLNTAYNGNFVIYNTVSQINDSKFEGLTSYAYRVAFNNTVSTYRLKVDTTGKSLAYGAAASHFFLTAYLYAGACIRTQLALSSPSAAVHTYFRLYLYENSKSGLVT